MNRTIEYTIPESQNGLRVEQFLRRKGYSRQNFTEIKRMPQSILVNGQCPGMVLPGSGKAFYLPLQQPPGPGYLRTYRNFQTPGQRQHYGRYDKKTPGTQGIPGNRKG